MIEWERGAINITHGEAHDMDADEEEELYQKYKMITFKSEDYTVDELDAIVQVYDDSTSSVLDCDYEFIIQQRADCDVTP